MVDRKTDIAARPIPNLLISPYARFNLRRNPFGELTREERAELAVVDVQRWLGLLDNPSAALQFLGNKGEGKTTHLLALERALPEATFIYLPEDAPLPKIPPKRPLLLDEVQRLPARHRRSVFKCGGPLVLGTHEDFSQELRSAGFKGGVTTVDVATEQSPDRLAQILNARIESSRISNNIVPYIKNSWTRSLLQQFSGNVREIERFLYDDFQTAAQTGSPWPNAT